MKKTFCLIALTTIILIGASSTWAGFYYSYTADNITDMMNSPTVLTFNDIAYSWYTSLTQYEGVVIDALPTSDSVQVTSAWVNNPSQYKYVDDHYVGYGTQSYTITFNQPISQFGMGFLDVNKPGHLLIAYDSSNYELERHELPYDSNLNSVFVGFKRNQSDISRIDFLNLSSAADSIGFDNVAFSRVAPVPIPPSVWLLGTGLVGLVGLRRRFKK